MSLKSSYNGLKRTNWDNKTDRQKAKTLQKHFEKLGYKLPQYLKGNKLSDVQLQKAINRVDNGYRKRIVKEEAQYYIKKFNKSEFESNYKSYKSQVKKDKTDFMSKLVKRGYSDDVIQAINDKYMDISHKGVSIDKPILHTLSKDVIIAMAKNNKINPSEMIKRLKQNSISNKEEMLRNNIVKAIDKIFAAHGTGLFNTDIESFKRKLQGHDYLGLSMIMELLDKRQDREDFINYNTNRNSEDRYKLIRQMEQHLIAYNQHNAPRVLKSSYR